MIVDAVGSLSYSLGGYLLPLEHAHHWYPSVQKLRHGRNREMRIASQRVLEAELDDFFEMVEPGRPRNSKDTEMYLALNESFSATNAAPCHRFPWHGDGITELRFDDQELLLRVTRIYPLDNQRKFVAYILSLLQEKDVETMHLRVKWSKNKERTVRITHFVNRERTLCFELL